MLDDTSTDHISFRSPQCLQKSEKHKTNSIFFPSLAVTFHVTFFPLYIYTHMKTSSNFAVFLENVRELY